MSKTAVDTLLVLLLSAALGIALGVMALVIVEAVL